MDDTIKHGTRENMNRAGAVLSAETKNLIGVKARNNWQNPAFVEKMKRRRKVTGEDHGSAKLNKEDVAAIRALHGRFTQKELAEQFGVEQSTINSVLNWKTWR